MVRTKLENLRIFIGINSSTNDFTKKFFRKSEDLLLKFEVKLEFICYSFYIDYLIIRLIINSFI